MLITPISVPSKLILGITQIIMVLSHINGERKRQTDRKTAKNVYPVMEVVSVAVKVIAEVVGSAYVPNK